MTERTITVHVDGMTCSHCQGRVEKALNGLDGVRAARVDLDAGTATVTGESLPSLETIRRAVEDAGYAVRDIT